MGKFYLCFWKLAIQKERTEENYEAQESPYEQAGQGRHINQRTWFVAGEVGYVGTKGAHLIITNFFVDI